MFDGDMLMIRSPDLVFDADLPNERYVGAIGSHRKMYFQTGMMLVIPSSDVFHALLYELQHNKHQRDFNGRDGRLIRTYFQEHYVVLERLLSIHIRPGDPLISHAIGLHYRGSWKPWYNREDPPAPPQRITADELGQELGEPYRLWWKTYEQLHVQCMTVQEALGADTRPDEAPAEYNASESMWLMRHTAQSYVQLMEWRDVQRRNVTLLGMRLLESAVGASCSETCGAVRIGDFDEALQCVENALSFVSVNSEETMRRVFHCRHISLDVPTPYHPSFDTQTRACYINSLHGKRERPTCDAKAPRHHRLCACLAPSNHRGNTVVAQPAPTANHRLEKVAVIPTATITTTSSSGSSSVSGDAAACMAWLSHSMHEVAMPERSRSCAAFLSQWYRVVAIPRQRNARTIKVRLHYKGQLSAIAKLEQLSFPLEPHAEYGAYVASLLLGIGMVPPTTLLRVPETVLREALWAQADEAERDFLERELWWIHTVGSAGMVTVSAQLWIPQDVVPFVNATPPITEDAFERWLEAESRDTTHVPGRSVMHDVATMVFFDYVIANEDRSFTHNAHVLEKRGTAQQQQLLLLDHGKSLHSETVELQGNRLFPRKVRVGEAQDGVADAEEVSVPMCKLSQAVLRQALRLSRRRYEPLARLLPHGEAKVDDVMGDSEGFAGLLLRSGPVTNVTWRLSEKSILAAQKRLDKALEHFARCAELFGLSFVAGG
ncbi:putative glycogenin glucosyltransferase [Trypanosoma grayi]|uniref:putative glycogenin glucosyltransferase n=1 Tax=Trypanosoma grayi TaxID=71804 RepID=UPI0004F42C77|nr:putative glycogenin glucosyltransferase [Trypanosoma grayi]KEG08654.1 putative glycogenin glucosyltransferase [Trypanosoma grayi]